jgi:hypothetical protein
VLTILRVRCDCGQVLYPDLRMNGEARVACRNCGDEFVLSLSTVAAPKPPSVPTSTIIAGRQLMASLIGYDVEHEREARKR